MTLITPTDSSLRNAIFVVGFPRGGTSWLRNCIGAHPQIGRIPGEIPLLKLRPDDIVAAVQEQIQEVSSNTPNANYFVSKAPVNSLIIDQLARQFTESKFVFIIRDPRDVYVSHKRGKQAWMSRGRNGSFKGVIAKMKEYFDHYERVAESPNIHLVRYEDLHQDFAKSMRSIFEFVGVETTRVELRAIRDKCDFIRQTGRKHIEDRGATQRKGVIGDWVNHLSSGDEELCRKNKFCQEFMGRFGYDWDSFTYSSVLTAMQKGGLRGLSEHDLLEESPTLDGRTVLLLHDIDELGSRKSHESILECARAEAAVEWPAIYNFLPIDDPRYNKLSAHDIRNLINEIKAINPLASIGLHLNAAERYFPSDAPDHAENEVDLRPAMTYLHRQIDDYADIGIEFHTSTAHGYGRGKKVPNNRDTPEFGEALTERGIALYDTVSRRRLAAVAEVTASLTDVGGPVRIRHMPHGGQLNDAGFWSSLPEGTFIRFLTHPGNYDLRKPFVLGARHDPC